MDNHNSSLRCTWTNGLIWMGISLGVLLLLRLLPWYFMFYMDIDTYPNAFCYGSVGAYIASAFFPILCYALTYRGYMARAAVNPQNLHGVAHGEYGRPWILWLILLIVFELVWIAITSAVIMISVQLDVRIPMERMIMTHFITMGEIFAVADLAMFLLGTFLFQPDLVRNAR